MTACVELKEASKLSLGCETLFKTLIAVKEMFEDEDTTKRGLLKVSNVQSREHRKNKGIKRKASTTRTNSPHAA